MDPITLETVRKAYGRVVALEEVSLAFAPGRIHGLVGANGSGKTTLLRLVAGLTEPTAGVVSVPDAAVGVSFQQPSVYPNLTVEENLDVFGRLVDADPDWRDHLVGVLRLDPVLGRPAADLSAGFGKKLDLALGLLKEPPVLLLDEPLADLDDLTQRRLVALLDDYVTSGRVVLISTHNVARFEGHLDRLVVMQDGSVRLDTPTADLDGGVEDAYAETLDERV